MEYQADIIIYGGTSSAVIAAVQAAQMGRAVILVSPDKHLGGMSSSGLGWTDVGNKDVIGGLTQEFYHRIFLHYQTPEAWIWQTQESYGNQGQDTPATDPESKTMWIFEPHVAEHIFNQMLQTENIPTHLQQRLDRQNGVEKVGQEIKSIQMLSGDIFKGKIFIDATYEGDLMAAAGVSYTIGREGNEVYLEQWNGIQRGVFHHDHHFKNDISPYVNSADPESGILPGISAYTPQVQGHGDTLIQAYCFRLCLTQHGPNKIVLSQPANYDPWQYELLIRVFDAGWDEFFFKFDPIPNLKTDVNNHGPFSFDNIGMNYDYPEENYERREEIIAEHRSYQEGLLYFVATDPRVPATIRNEMNQWGYAANEFEDNGNWPYQLYIREARRMRGEFVMTEDEILGIQSAPNSIGMGSYMLDSHNVQRYIKCDGFVQNEGDIGVVPPHPYTIALGTILPQINECENLIVPVALSASHTAFGSLRMEPVFMVLGQSAATLAGLAVEQDKTLHQVSYNDLRNRLLADEQVLEWNP